MIEFEIQSWTFKILSHGDQAEPPFLVELILSSAEEMGLSASLRLHSMARPLPKNKADETSVVAHFYIEQFQCLEECLEDEFPYIQWDPANPQHVIVYNKVKGS